MHVIKIAVLMLAGVLLGSVAWAGERGEFEREDIQTIAVFGDWPYNNLLLNNAARLIDSVNADREVSLVMHLGDIHAGGSPCTSAGVLPPIPTSDPGWNQTIYSLFQKFEAPLVYTPGDNEWTDCHRSKTRSSGYPLKELDSLRSLFFAKPGHTLGLHEKKVASQALQFDPAYPADARYVENMMWQDAGVVFVTLNMPGSNNDSLPWTGIFADPGLQMQEVSERTAADMRWMQMAFDQARRKHAKAVVIAIQADMWDRYASQPGGDGLDQYTVFVKKLATLSIQFGRPVLLLNGDSHVFGVDQPLADPESATGKIHQTPAVPNLTRMTVQGATTAPAEWLKLTIDTRKPYPFSWQNVPYCTNPSLSCQ